MKTIRYLAVAATVIAAVIAIGSRKERQETFTRRDYPEILASGVLRAVTEYNTISFHVAGDTIQGFDYELLQTFASDKGLKLEITPEMSFAKRMEGIGEGRYDLLASGTAVTSELRDSLLFTRPLLLNRQVLVQRKRQEEADSLYIRNQLELAHKTLYVIRNSPALLRIHNLIEEIADTIYVKEIDRYGAEQLMAMVAGGDIDYAVCDEYIARACAGLYTNLDINTDISFTQFYAWGTGRHAPQLRDSLDRWLEEYLESEEYKRLYRKFFSASLAGQGHARPKTPA